MTKQIYIRATFRRAAFRLLIMLTLGFLATPTQTYACGSNSEKVEKSCEESPCCKKVKTNKTEKKDCCKKHTSNKSHSDKHQNHDSCGGKCGHSSCHCPTFNFVFTLPFIAEITNNNFAISSKKQKFYHNETYLSSGFLSIWTPPNIG